MRYLKNFEIFGQKMTKFFRKNRFSQNQKISLPNELRSRISHRKPVKSVLKKNVQKSILFEIFGQKLENFKFWAKNGHRSGQKS